MLPVLRDLLIQQLTENTWAPEDQLKVYLEGGPGAFSTDEEYDWFTEVFPEELPLSHSHQFLSTFDGISTIIFEFIVF